MVTPTRNNSSLEYTSTHITPPTHITHTNNNKYNLKDTAINLVLRKNYDKLIEIPTKTLILFSYYVTQCFLAKRVYYNTQNLLTHQCSTLMKSFQWVWSYVFKTSNTVRNFNIKQWETKTNFKIRKRPQSHGQ